MNHNALVLPVLLIEDDLELGAELQRAFHTLGMACVWVRRIREARNQLPRKDDHRYCCVVLDLGLPDGEGMALLRAWRQDGQYVPVIILSARDALDSRVSGLDAGADDYVVKPVMPVELVSRIRAVVRRHAGQGKAVWAVGALEIDPSRHEVRMNAQEVSLSPKEYVLVSELARHAGSVVTKQRLARSIDALGEQVDFNALEVHIHNLRRKLGAATIRTIRGVGYRLES